MVELAASAADQAEAGRHQHDVSVRVLRSDLEKLARSLRDGQAVSERSVSNSADQLTAAIDAMANRIVALCLSGTAVAAIAVAAIVVLAR